MWFRPGLDPLEEFIEFRHLLITSKLRPAGRIDDQHHKVSLLPSNDMSEEMRKDYKPIALGALDI